MKLNTLKTISLFMAFFPTCLFSQNFKSQAIWSFDLQFDFSKSDIRPVHYPRLDSLANAVSKDSSLFIDLNAYTDAIGSDKANQELSINRAKAIYEYLVEKGISKNRLVYNGYANWELIYDDPQTFEQDAANRRVEIRILSKDEFKKLKKEATGTH